MLHHYLKTTVRTLRRHSGYTTLNILGLTVGMACFLVAALYLYDELTYDRFHANADRVYRVVETSQTPERRERTGTTIGPVAPALVADLTGVEAATRLTHFARVTMEHGERRFYEGHYLVADSNVFDVLQGFAFAEGDPDTALDGPGRVVLTPDAAQKYFGTDDVMGKVLSAEAFGDLTVTGVLAPIPANSHLDFSMLISEATVAEVAEFWEQATTDWSTSFRDFATYALLADKTRPASVAEELSRFMDERRAGTATDIQLSLQPLADIHLYSGEIQGGYNAGERDVSYLILLATIGLAVLVVACINYTNMATARALQRAREVGLRKSLGAGRRQVARQFLMESVVLALGAFGVAVALVYTVLPSINTLTGKALSVAGGEVVALGSGLALVALVVGLLAGSYPALYLSGIRPARAFREAAASSVGTARLRRGLVVVQFALSIALLVTTLAAYTQFEYIRSKGLGFDKENIIAVDINSGEVRQQARAMRAEMAKHPGVEHVTITSRVPNDWKGIPEVEVKTGGVAQTQTAHFMAVDPAFLSTYAIDLVAGRNFEAGAAADSSSVLINRTAARQLGIEGTGATIRMPLSDDGDEVFEARVLGIVEDFHVQPLYESIGPLILGYWQSPIDDIDYFSVRFDGGQAAAVIEHLRGIGERFDPAHPFEYNMLDARIGDHYKADRQTGYMIALFSGLAIFVACLGLIGLAAFVTSRRAKEISVRKVLGASVASIVALLTRQFVHLVLVGFVVATPVAFLAVQWWQQQFAYHADIGPLVYLAAGAAVLAIALLTIGAQTVRAALADPAQTLRTE